MKPKVKVIILNWNQANLTIDCIRSVKEMKYDNFDVLVIDNASSDESVEKIKNTFDDVEVLSLDKNYKFAGAYNRAFEYIDFKDNYFLFLNNDTIVQPDLLDCFVSDSKLYINSILSPKINYLNDKNKIWYAGGEVNLSKGVINHIGIRQIDCSRYNSVSKTGYITGCCMFLSKETFLSLNGFDTRFNMYGEDVDFCLRAIEKGINLFYVPKSVIFHHVSASIPNSKKNINQILSVWKLMRKHLGLIDGYKGFCLYLFKNFRKVLN